MKMTLKDYTTEELKVELKRKIETNFNGMNFRIIIV